MSDCENMIAADLAATRESVKRYYRGRIAELRAECGKALEKLEALHKDKVVALRVANGKGFEAGLIETANAKNPFDKDSEWNRCLWNAWENGYKAGKDTSLG